MSNATNISVARDDGTSITLVPVSSQSRNGVTEVIFRELSATKSLAACVVLTLSAETLKSGVIKTSRKLEVPIMEIIPSGAVNADGRTASPKVSHIETDVRTRFHHPRCTATERADSYRMASHVDISGSATANACVVTATTAADTFRDVASTFQVPYGDVNYVWPSA